MKRFLCIFTLVFLCCMSLPAQTVDSDSLTLKVSRTFHDRLFASDKGHHFMASAFLAGFTYYAFRQEFGVSDRESNGAAIGIAFTIGLAKEVYDGVSGKGTPSFKDIVADAAGIAAAIIIFNISSE